MIERTLSLIKPRDAAARNLTGEILARIQRAGLGIAALKMTRMTRAQAEGFYAVHRERPFFDGLVTYMTSGPVVCAVLEGEDAIRRYRELMGATDPAQAAEGTLRRLYALDRERNAVHGSDAPETAAFEIGYCFSALDIMA